MDRGTLQSWLDRYVEAWRSYDAEQIGALFSDDAEYRYHPWDEPIRGRDAIVASWLEDPDDAGSWRARYVPFAVDGGDAVAVGTSTYLKADGSVDRTYHNAYVMRFADDGRCQSFIEWFILEP